MIELDEIREAAPFAECEQWGSLTGQANSFSVAMRYDDIVTISKSPDNFRSGQGSVSIQDLPAEANEFFGSFINMDNPRHQRQRSIVARSFTPRDLANVFDLVERVADEVIDEFCETGEVDLVEVLSQPFPLRIICDMMGIPKSEFGAVLKATNIILGAGDPDFFEGGDPVVETLGAGALLADLMNELAEDRRSSPTNDLTSQLVHGVDGGETLAEHELAPFFILLATAGNDTTRNAITHGLNLLHLYPEQRQIWQNDPANVTKTAVEEIVRYSSPVTFMRRTATRDVTVNGRAFSEGDKVVMLYGAANRDPRQFNDPATFDVLREHNPHLGFGGPGPHFCLGANLARRELGVIFERLFTRLPDIEVTGPAVPLNATVLPLVSGVKSLPVSFTPTAPVLN